MVNTTGNLSDKNHHEQNILLEKELAALEDIIVTVGSTIKVEKVLERIVEVTANTVDADDLFIYLLDEKNKELILSAATKNQAYIYKGEFRIKVGVGVTGHVALTHEMYLIQENLKRNPKFVLTPELGDCNYESFLCVPIVSQTNKLIGVMSIYSAEMYYFHDEHIHMARRIALLVAGALENAKLYELTNKRAYVLERLANLSSSNMPNMTTDQCLGMVTEIIGDIFKSELSLTIIYDELTPKNFIFKSHFHAENESKEKKRIIQRNLTKVNSKVSNKEVNNLNISTELECNIYRLFKNYISTKIVRGSESLGSIHCFSNKKSFSREDQSILNLIANQIALIVQNKLLEEQFEEVNEKKNFFNDIELGNITCDELITKIEKFGLNHKNQHIFLVVTISNKPIDKDIHAIFEGVLEILNRHSSRTLSAINQEEMIVLIPSTDNYFINNLKKVLNKTQTSLKKDNIIFTIGISQPTYYTNDYTTALREAREALKIGSWLFGVGDTYTLEDVSYYLYLSQFSNGIKLREPYKIRVQQVAEYDKRNDTQLFSTLKLFLKYGGNIQKTANSLFAHRNTIYKRIKKIEEITLMDLSIEHQWFPLQLALKIYELRNITGLYETQNN